MQRNVNVLTDQENLLQQKLPAVGPWSESQTRWGGGPVEEQLVNEAISNVYNHTAYSQSIETAANTPTSFCVPHHCRCLWRTCHTHKQQGKNCSLSISVNIYVHANFCTYITLHLYPCCFFTFASFLPLQDPKKWALSRVLAFSSCCEITYTHRSWQNSRYTHFIYSIQYRLKV